MDTKHTPGPWSLESDGTTVSMGGQVCVVCPAPEGASRAEEKANAALIAAAPDLLAACRVLLRAAEYMDLEATKHGRGVCNGPHAGNVCGDPNCPLCAARAAIAKAEGR